MALAVVVSAATVGLTMFGALDLLGRSHTRSPRYFGAIVGLIQPFFMMPCDGRKLR